MILLLADTLVLVPCSAHRLPTERHTQACGLGESAELRHDGGESSQAAGMLRIQLEGACERGGSLFQRCSFVA